MAEPEIKNTFGLFNQIDTFTACLQKNDIDPDSIKKVILTHLHWDHCWNMDKLPNAEFYVQKKEIQSAVSPMPYEKIHYAYWGGIYEIPVFLKCINQVTALEGESQIAPGIRVIPTPGHTAGSQTVLVDTSKGTFAIVGDFANLPMALEGKGWPPGLITSAEDWYESFARLKKENYQKVLTFHDNEAYGTIYD